MNFSQTLVVQEITKKDIIWIINFTFLTFVLDNMASCGRSRTRRGQRQVALDISNFNNWTKERLSSEIKSVTGVNLNAISTPRNVLLQVYRDNVEGNSAPMVNDNVGQSNAQSQNLQQVPLQQSDI